MRIRFLSGPRKGETTHAPTNQNTQLLVDAGLAEVVPPEPLPPATVGWAVKFDTYGAPMLVGNCSRGCGFFRFLGRPDLAHKNYFQHSCGAMPVPIPAEVIEQYRKAYGEATPSATGDDTKLVNARAISNTIDRNADAQFERIYGRSRRW